VSKPVARIEVTAAAVTQIPDHTCDIVASRDPGFSESLRASSNPGYELIRRAETIVHANAEDVIAYRAVDLESQGFWQRSGGGDQIIRGVTCTLSLVVATYSLPVMAVLVARKSDVADLRSRLNAPKSGTPDFRAIHAFGSARKDVDGWPGGRP
jgi:hypothetical protein